MSPGADEILKIDVQQISGELKIRPEIYIKIVTSFSQTLLDKVRGLEEALAKMDITTMRAILHEIKGTSSNLRLTAVTAASEVMHIEVKGDAHPEKLKTSLTELANQAVKLKATVPSLSA